MRLGTGRYGAMLAKFLTGTAELNVAPELSPEISPVFVLENDRPEWFYLGNQRMMAGASGVGAVALQSSNVRFRNPRGSNVLAVVEGMILECAGSRVQLALSMVDAADLAGVATTVSPRDSRSITAGVTRGACILSAANNIPLTGLIIEDVTIAANQPFYSGVTPLVLAPGSSLNIVTLSAVDAFVNFKWREREITRYEL